MVRGQLLIMVAPMVVKRMFCAINHFLKDRHNYVN